MLHLMACSFLLFARAHHSELRLSLRHGLDANALALLQLCKRIAIWVFHGPDAVVVARRVGLLEWRWEMVALGRDLGVTAVERKLLV